MFDPYQLLVGLHLAGIAGLALYGVHRLWFLLCWLRERTLSGSGVAVVNVSDEKPAVIVQLPIYNERFVAARLIDATAGLDWPQDKLEIQVLDDSDDDTSDIVDERVAWWSRQGVSIQVLRRQDRSGFKAGALDWGLSVSSGELIAIFDADFFPAEDFLQRTTPHFSDSGVGMVQARWGFMNQDHSWLTRIQTLLLGSHFNIEHLVRFRRGYFFNFNGTAGIWRREAIDASGGWQSDTVTEDLDLSYRAQLAGWRFVYLDDLGVSSELPVTLGAFRRQQQRWAKGSIQTARKILPRVLASPSLPWGVKVQAMAHLLANLGWLCGTLVTFTLYPALKFWGRAGTEDMGLMGIYLFWGATASILIYYAGYIVGRKDWKQLRFLPLLPFFSIGMAPSLCLAVLQGMWANGGTFERTPKYGIQGRDRMPGLAFLYRERFSPYILLNALLVTYQVCIIAVFVHLGREPGPVVAYLCPFLSGFCLVLWREVDEWTRASSAPKSRVFLRPAAGSAKLKGRHTERQS